MAMKRKFNFSNISSVEEPADNASVHGVVTFLSHVKSLKRGAGYFDAIMSDGKETMKLVGFKESQHAKMREFVEKSSIVLDDCQIKKAKRGSGMAQDCGQCKNVICI